MAIIFDGRKFAQEKEKELRERVRKLKVKPKLVVVLVGDSPASQLYVMKKKEAAERVEIKFELKKFKKSASEQTIIDFIKKKNGEKAVTGIIVQLPLPKKFNEIKIRRAINSDKDVDCLHPKNLGLLMMGKPVYMPAAVKAVLEIILIAVTPPRSASAHLAGVTIAGKEVVIVGGSNLVGKPLAMVLSNLGATVTICRSTTLDLAKHSREADILVSAVGKQSLITKEMIKKGAVVIDVGERGDVKEDVAQIASFIAPVPGGVGPMTVVSLLENMLELVS